ncbi:MAG TPA: hypothetical protein VK674_03595 [Candidatus Limnocylindria bacterium]|nr:hypothetical protein [Candidatus Limnocylindria bacterium]
MSLFGRRSAPTPPAAERFLPEMNRPPIEVAQLTAESIETIRRSVGLVALSLDEVNARGFVTRVPAEDEHDGQPIGAHYAHFGYEGLTATPDAPDTVLFHGLRAPDSQSSIGPDGRWHWVGIDWTGDDQQFGRVETVLELQDTKASGILSRADQIVRAAQGL